MTDVEIGDSPEVRDRDSGGRPSLLRAGWLSHVGRMRDRNEDALIAVSGDFEQGTTRQTIGVFAVADGMGGYEQGERASALAARTVADALVKQFVAPVMHGSRSTASLQEVMSDAIMAAHTQLQDQLPGAGTTLTVALIADDSLAVAHVGDSRAYLCRDGTVHQVTRDHSLVARLVEMGQHTPEQAAQDPRRNILYRALGLTESLEVDFDFLEFPPNSRLLICSDGLWGHVDARVLEQVVSQAADPQDACETLVEMANEAGGPDNITAICVIRP